MSKSLFFPDRTEWCSFHKIPDFSCSHCVKRVFYGASVLKCTDMCKHRFAVQLLKNPPLCSSNTRPLRLPSQNNFPPIAVTLNKTSTRATCLGCGLCGSKVSVCCTPTLMLPESHLPVIEGCNRLFQPPLSALPISAQDYIREILLKLYKKRQ